MAAPFVVVMIVMCVALIKDLNSDPLIQRFRKVTEATEQAVAFGTENFSDDFHLTVKPNRPEAQPASDGVPRGAVGLPESRTSDASEQGSPLDRADRI